MKKLGVQDIRRGKRCWTTVADDSLYRPSDKVNRQFTAIRPNQLWVADITFVATWIGFVYVANIEASVGSIDDVEFAILEWVDWFNNRRLLEPIGNIPPSEFEMAYYRQLRESADAA